jgi:hypothetical protein
LGIPLIPYTIEIVTAITIILIGAILAVYLSILKRNGWIGETPNYRCPNPQCKKIFQTPLKVKDFSNKKEVHLACPECGYDLGSLNGKKGLKEITLQSEPELKIQDLTSKRIETEGSTTNNGSKEPNALRDAAPIVESKKNETSPEIDHGLFLKQELDDSKKDRPAGCNHYFRYLGTLSKGTKTPDECYSCSSLIECYKKASD